MTENKPVLLVTWGDDYDATNTYVAEWIPAKRWNGSLMPWFSLAESMRIADDQKTNLPFNPQFRWKDGGFQVDMGDDYMEDGAADSWHDVPSMVDAAGNKLFQMGDGWLWHLVERPVPEDQEDYDAIDRALEWDDLKAEVLAANYESGEADPAWKAAGMSPNGDPRC
jgi:hypothetical protein